jgi:hypothetical protein
MWHGCILFLTLTLTLCGPVLAEDKSFPDVSDDVAKLHGKVSLTVPANGEPIMTIPEQPMQNDKKFSRRVVATTDAAGVVTLDEIAPVGRHAEEESSSAESQDHLPTQSQLAGLLRHDPSKSKADDDDDSLRTDAADDSPDVQVYHDKDGAGKNILVRTYRPSLELDGEDENEEEELVLADDEPSSSSASASGSATPQDQQVVEAAPATTSLPSMLEDEHWIQHARNRAQGGVSVATFVLAVLFSGTLGALVMVMYNNRQSSSVRRSFAQEVRQVSIRETEEESMSITTLDKAADAVADAVTKTMSFAGFGRPEGFGLSNPLAGHLRYSPDEWPREYDFTLKDDSSQWPTQFWKWMTKEDAETIGVMVQAPVRDYNEHERIEVAANAQAVKAVLSKTAAGQLTRSGDMQRILWQLLRAECYFMATQDGTSVVLLIETVRLRCVENGRILIQEADGSLLHQSIGFPGIEKACHQSPVDAATLMWKDVLRMPEGAADFIEDVVEDVEFTGYDGIKCVERKHVMHVKLRTQDPAVISQIGLPDHMSFAVEAQDGSQSRHVEDRPERKFKWITFSELLKICEGLPVQNADVRGSSLVEGATPTEDLVDFLLQGGVDPDLWDARPGSERGSNNPKKVQLLLKELQAGKCYLEQNSSQGMMRVVNYVYLRIWSPDQHYLLVDRGRSDDQGEEVWDAPSLPSCKKLKSQTIKEEVLKKCEHLNLFENDIHFKEEGSWEYFDTVEPSSRFKGLVTKYQKFFVDIVMEEDDALVEKLHVPKEEHDY